MPNPKKPRSNCLNCAKECKTPQHKYCDHACHKQHRYNQYIARWKQDLEQGWVGKQRQISEHLRKYVWEKKGPACWHCGWNERNPITNKSPLQIDHINGNAEDCTENNLRLLCPNCHSLTPTYGNLNKGKGRSKRYN